MLFRLARFLVKWFLKLIFFVRVHGAENFPKEGPAIAGINHKSYWDIPLTDSQLPRPLCFMAKHDLFDIPVLSGLMKWSGAFPVKRDSGDIGAVKTALSILKEGKVLAIFPEGRRVKKGGVHRAKPGIALIAEKSGAPVIPVAIKGDYKLFRRTELYVGKPIYVKSEDGKKLPIEALQEYSNQILDSILTMEGRD